MNNRLLLPLLFASLATSACGPEVSARAVPEMSPANATPEQHPDSVMLSSAVTPSADHSPAGAFAGMQAMLYSDLDAEVGARMTGVVRAINAELGDAVTARQVLATLDDARQVARVASATAARDLMRAEFERSSGLLSRGFVTAAQHDEAQYRLRVAEATLREAEIELEHTHILAPFAGVVTRRLTGVGRPVEEGEPLFRVTALQPLRAISRVPEQDARAIRQGARAVLVGEGGVEVEAIVARVSAAVDPASGTVEVLFDVPKPGALKPGSGAIVQLRRISEPR